MDLTTTQLAPGEVLAFYSFLALGAHFAAVVSGENSPFSLGEISNQITTLGDMTVEYSHRQTGRSTRAGAVAGSLRFALHCYRINETGGKSCEPSLSLL
jgi:hypothetical protein